MAMNGYSAFPKAPAFVEPHHQTVKMLYAGYSLPRGYSSVETQSVYSTATVDWKKNNSIHTTTHEMQKKARHK